MEPMKKYKVFQYKTKVQWTGERTGLLRGEGKPDISVANPPEFKGVPNVWTPEDLFVAALNICLMNTFVASLLRKGIILISYKSEAEATLDFVEGNYRFVSARILPRINVKGSVTEADIAQIVREAHEGCVIANSINTPVEVKPSISIVS
ncbi:MAG: OsmC family protein [Bacteroidota bacterium]